MDRALAAMAAARRIGLWVQADLEFHRAILNATIVIVNGRIVKQYGRLVGVDWPALSQRLRASAERILERAAKVDAAPIHGFVGRVVPQPGLKHRTAQEAGLET